MPKLLHSLHDWPSGPFAATLKREIEGLAPGTLPLQDGASPGRYVDDSDTTVTVLRFDEDMGAIRAGVGVFYTAIVGSCGCGDEPYAENAYCELLVRIDKATAEAEFTVVPA